MKVTERSKDLLSQIAKLPEEDQEIVLGTVLLLSKAPETARMRSCELLAELIENRDNKKSTAAKLAKILAYLQANTEV